MFAIQYWQLAADAGLVLALLFLAVRFTRSNSSFSQAKSDELMRALKALINDAEEAGRLLNERLIKRQQQLEKVLVELEGAESKIEKIEVSAEKVLSNLKDQQSQAQNTLDKFGQAVKQYSELAVEVSVEGQVGETRRSDVAATQPIPSPSQHEQKIEDIAEKIITESPNAAELTQTASSSPVNIYGEPIAPKTSSLAQSVEREHVAPVDNNPIQALETVYDAAEKMLRAGYNLSAVQKHTKLPFDELEMLAQIVGNNSQKPQQPEIVMPITQGSPIFAGEQIKDNPADARLGVLGGVRRTRITV